MVSTTRFRPGAHTAIVGPATAALVACDDGVVALDRLRDAVYDGAPVDDLLEVIAQIGLRRLPSLALLRREPGGVRVLVRGDFVVVATGPGGVRRVEASGVRTFTEQLLDGVLCAEVSSNDITGGFEYELSGGTVPASGLAWSATGPSVETTGAPPLSTPVDVGVVADDAAAAEAPASVELDERAGDGRDDATAIDDVVVDDAMVLDEVTVVDDVVLDDVTVVDDDVVEAAAVEADGDAALVDVSSTIVAVDEADDDDDDVVAAADVVAEDAAIDEPVEDPPTDVAATELPPPLPHPDDYDHLFGATRMETVEHAAVREPAAEPAPVSTRPADRTEPADEPAGSPESDAPVVSAHPAVAPPPPARPGMIDGVPGLSSPSPSMPSAPLPPSVWVGPAAEPHPGQSPTQGDHDGMTIRGPALASITGNAPASGPGAWAVRPGSPSVPAVHCPTGHPNPPTSERCRMCHQPVTSAPPAMIARPTLGVFKLSSGTNVPVDRPLVLGRAPKLAGVPGDEIPHLVTVPSPDQSVSRSHIEVRLDGWHVLVVDLNTVNGTSVQMPGQRPQRLTPGAPFPIVPGAVIDLGGGVTCLYEVQ